MARYEFSEGSSNKFWEITLDDTTVTTRYGRIGSDGQETTKDYKTKAEAKKAYDKLVAEKTKKGYTLAAGGEDDEEGDGDDEEAAAPSGPSNPELEHAILARPDDVDAYLVYGDWLQSQGDTRGELIAVQAALLKSPTSKELHKTEEALLKKHARAWLGALAAQKALKPTWRLGFVDELHMEYNYYEEDEQDLDAGELLGQLLAAPAGRLLRKLHVGLWSNDEGQGDYSSIVEALAETRPPALRELFLADFSYPDDMEMSWTDLGDVEPLWSALPRLEKVTLQAGAMELGKIDAPALTQFEVRTGGLSGASIASICAARWPNLESLKVWFGDDNYGAEGTVDSIAAILDGKGLGKLKHLGIMNCAFIDDACAALGTSKIVKQLETLDLTMGTMTIEGARRLVQHAAAFKHLKELDVGENVLDDEAQALLKKELPNVVIGEQREDDPEYRYVSVGE